MSCHLERPIDRILSRLECVRKTARGFSARCPAHEDRSPSFGIRETSDGTVLLKCLAGCTASDIVRALGLELKDLFPSERELPTPTASRRKPSTGTIREALRKEYDRLVSDGEKNETATMNRARARISRIYGVELAPLRSRLHEGYGPHGEDPLWAALFRLHADNALRKMGSRLSCDDRERLNLPIPTRVRIAAEDRATRDFHRSFRLAEAA